VATVSSIDQIVGLFHRIASHLQASFAKEKYNFIDPTNCSHPIVILYSQFSGMLTHTYTNTHTHTQAHTHTYTHTQRIVNCLMAEYGVATISRMRKNIGLFCRRALQKRPVFCKETCIFKHPTNRSHPIGCVNLYWPQKNGENRNSKNWRMLVILMYTSALTRKSTPYTHRHRHKHRCIHSYTDTQPHRHTDTHTLSHTHSYTHPHTNCGTAFKIDLKYCMCKVMDGDKN